jgi:hypothetical protein
MDLLRSGYKRDMRFVRDDPGPVVEAIWYRCAPSALPFPGPHRFGSGNWDTVHPSPSDLGDQDDLLRTYYNGRRLNSSDGRSFAGPLEFFQEGADGPALLPRGGDGFTPVECIRPPFGIVKGGLSVPTVGDLGGVIKSGTSTTPANPLVCSTFTTTLTATVLSGTGTAAPFVGQTFPVPHLFGPLWEGSSTVGLDILNFAGGCTGGTMTFSCHINIGPTFTGLPTATTDPFNVTWTGSNGTDTVVIQIVS